MIVGLFRYLSPVFLFSSFVLSVVSSPVRNDTRFPSEIDRSWKGNESSINIRMQKGTSKFSGLWHIYEQGNDSWLCIFCNGSNLTLEAFGSNKEIKGSKPARIHLCCRQDKRLRSDVTDFGDDCDIVVALYGVDLSVNWCPSEKVRSHDSTNISFVLVSRNPTKEECQGRLVASTHSRQSKRLNQVRFTIQRELCVKIPKRMETLANCCYNIAVPTSHKDKTILKSAHRDLEAQLDYERAREVQDYIHQSIISLVVCVLLIIGVFLTVMTYNLWSSRKRYQDSLKSKNVEET